MTNYPRFPDGYYDDNGIWQRTKFCFVYCGEHCTCQPPFDAWRKNEPETDEPKEDSINT